MPDKTDGPPVVQLGAHSVTLKAPGSITICADLFSAVLTNETRGLAACLVACWNGPGRPRIRYDQTGYNPMIYGGQAMDALLKMGIGLPDIRGYGQVAHMLIGEQVPMMTAVLEAEDFSEAPEDG